MERNKYTMRSRVGSAKARKMSNMDAMRITYKEFFISVNETLEISAQPIRHLPEYMQTIARSVLVNIARDCVTDEKSLRVAPADQTGRAFA
jgi:hypothetical protein